ncbi:hypothetical protein AGMMS50212_08360 [Spirochaetia bacterium]|nr:hypothetical protein AGMMS50212_08360 [Spirochaetia bacterium]
MTKFNTVLLFTLSFAVIFALSSCEDTTKEVTPAASVAQGFSPPSDALTAGSEHQLRAWLTDPTEYYSKIVYTVTQVNKITAPLTVPKDKILYLNGLCVFSGGTSLTVEKDGEVHFYDGNFHISGENAIVAVGPLLVESGSLVFADLTSNSINGFDKTVSFMSGSTFYLEKSTTPISNLAPYLRNIGVAADFWGTINDAPPSEIIRVVGDNVNVNRSIVLYTEQPELGTTESIEVREGLIILSDGGTVLPALKTLTINGGFFYKSGTLGTSDEGLAITLGPKANLFLPSVGKLANNVTVPQSASFTINKIENNNSKQIVFKAGNKNRHAPNSSIDLVFSGVSNGTWLLNEPNVTLGDKEVIMMPSDPFEFVLLGLSLPTPNSAFTLGTGSTLTNNGIIYVSGGSATLTKGGGVITGPGTVLSP